MVLLFTNIRKRSEKPSQIYEREVQRSIATMTVSKQQQRIMTLLLLAVLWSSWSVMMPVLKPTRQLHANMTPWKSTTETSPVVVQSQCNETAFIANWTFTSLADAADYPHYNELSDFLEGNGLTTPNDKGAVCVFREIKYSTHFPHAYVL
jgi:hypothetical protein